jgi:D-3-phosphoglycerate dehydrogenase
VGQVQVFVTHNPEDRDAYFCRALPLLESIDGVNVVLNPQDRDLTPAELIDAAQASQVIIAHRSTPGPAPLFTAVPELLAMFRTAIDISTIDVAAASEAGVLVANADKSFIASTAELALGLLIDCARNVSASNVDYAAGREPPQRTGRQLAGKTVGIIGFGSIGSYLAELLRAVGMRVLICDPQTDPGSAGFERVDFADLLQQSEVIIPLTPGDEANFHLIGQAELAAMPPGAMLINVSRGEVLDESAVRAALASGHLGAVGLDVGMGPDQRPSSVLIGQPGVVATPHLGGLTPANAYAQAESAVDQVRAIVAGSMPPRAVNPESATRLQAYWAQT